MAFNSMKVGTGFSSNVNAIEAGKEIAEQALNNGEITNANFAFVFCNSGVNAQQLLKGIRKKLDPEIPVLGGSGIGIITNEKISYDGAASGMVIIEKDGINIQTAFANGLNKDEKICGQMLVEQLVAESDDTLILFYDSIKKPAGPENPPILNSSIPLLQGIEENIKNPVRVVGGGTLGDYSFSNTYQFAGNKVTSQTACAVLLNSEIQSNIVITHGCSPLDGIYHTITKVEGPIIYELDNRPIVEVINEIYGNADWQNQMPVRRLTIGINYGEKFSEYNEADYVNRLITGILPDKSGIVIFESGLNKGEVIQFMLRDSRKMFESAENNIKNIINQIQSSGRKPVWGFYIDCAGRTSMFSETVNEEAKIVQDIFNKNNITLFGFYSGVEIAPFHNKNLGLDWTGVLLIISE